MVTERPAEVAEIRTCFESGAGIARGFIPRHCTALLWSNRNSRCTWRVHRHSRRSLDIQHPKYVDATILKRIVRRPTGVNVRSLCGGKHGISEWDTFDTFASLRVMGRFGVKVHKQKNFRVGQTADGR